MSRLTERFSNGQAASYWCGDDCKYDHKYCDPNNEKDCPTIVDIIEKLAHYEDLEEQDRLKILPCNIGDTVWVITNNEIIQCIVRQIKFHVNGKGVSITCRGSYKNSRNWYNGVFRISSFGKVVFTTEEEAEAKLKEMEGAE